MTLLAHLWEEGEGHAWCPWEKASICGSTALLVGGFGGVVGYARAWRDCLRDADRSVPEEPTELHPGQQGHPGSYPGGCAAKRAKRQPHDDRQVHHPPDGGPPRRGWVSDDE